MKSFHFLLTSALVLACGCSENGIVKLQDDIVTQVELEEISSDVKVIPIKCSQPMKNTLIYNSFGDYDFLLSEDYRTIYCLEGDSITSILEKAGRGRGEYPSISTFAFSQNDTMMYVVDASGKLYMYKGFDYEFVDMVDITSRVLSIVPFNNKLLATCYIPENEEEERCGFFMIDTKTGEITETVQTMNYLGLYAHQYSDFYQSDDSLYFSVADNEVNKIYLLYKDKLSTTFEFSYSKDMRLPKRVLVKNPEDLSELLIFNRYVFNNTYCVGANYPIVKNNGRNISFWSFPDARNGILNIIDDGNVKRYNLKITGILGLVEPECVSNDYYVAIYKSIIQEVKGDDVKGGSLSEKIISEYGKNEGNPVVVKFRVR